MKEAIALVIVGVALVSLGLALRSDDRAKIAAVQAESAVTAKPSVTMSAPLERQVVVPIIQENVPAPIEAEVPVDPTALRNLHNGLARRGINRLGSEVSLAEKRLLWEILEDHESVEALVITPQAFYLMDQLIDGQVALGHLREAEAGLPDESAEKARQLTVFVATELRELVRQLRSELNL